MLTETALPAVEGGCGQDGAVRVRVTLRTEQGGRQLVRDPETERWRPAQFTGFW